MPLSFQTPMDRAGDPDDETHDEPLSNGFHIYQAASVEELFGGTDEPEPRPSPVPRRPLQPAFVPREDIDKLHALIANAPRREQFPPFKAAPGKTHRHWWGLGADCCYIVVKAGYFLMACWIFAIGLPLMLLLLLSGGHLDMAYLFLGSLFGAYVDATPDRQYAFASQSTWVLVGLATVVAACRLPRFLDEVSEGLKTWRKVL